MSHINLQQATTTEIGDSWRFRKIKSQTNMLRSIDKQSRESVESAQKRKGFFSKLRWERFAEKESFKPGVKE